MKVKFDSANELSIKVNLSDGSRSRSGNSTVLASSRGNQLIGNRNGRPVFLQLNVLEMDKGSKSAKISLEGAPKNVVEITRGRAAGTGAKHANGHRKPSRSVNGGGGGSPKVA